jgi:mannose-1-phosphate guanylyltransferase
MEAVLLAGGFGTRLRPLTYTHPKPLLPVGGRAMLEWVLDRLPKEVTKVIVAVNWQAEALEAYFAASDRDLEFAVVRESEPLGTAGAVKNCQEHLTSDQFFVLNADIISDMDLEGMIKMHRAKNAHCTIALKEVPAAEVVNYGVIQPDPADADRVIGFVEKPKDPSLAPSRLINAGAYLLNHSVLDLIAKDTMVSMEKEIFPQLLEPGFYGVPFSGYWMDVGTPERLLEASAHLSAQWHGADSKVLGDVTNSAAGRGLKVAAGATVTNCVIGDNVTINANVTNCVIGDGETVEKETKNLRIWTQPLPAGYPDKQVGNAL